MSRLLTYRPSENEIACPEPTVDTKPFWDATLQGILLLQRCVACDQMQYPYRTHCDICLATSLSWAKSSGRARLISFSAVRRAPSPAWAQRVPYVLAVVALSEGPQVLTNIVECAAESLAIGMSLEATFAPCGDDTAVPYFRPVVSRQAELKWSR